MDYINRSLRSFEGIKLRARKDHTQIIDCEDKKTAIVKVFIINGLYVSVFNFSITINSTLKVLQRQLAYIEQPT